MCRRAGPLLGGAGKPQAAASGSDEPGLQELASQLALPLLYFSSEELAIYQQRLSHHSQIAYERTGCYGVAESAALALAEQLIQAPAKLLISRQKYAQATLALAGAA